jgi:PAS domain S-box-containing protein
MYLNEISQIGDAIIEASPNGVLVVDDAGRIAYANASLLKMFGYDKDELLEQFIEILLPEKQMQRHTALRNGFLRAPSQRQMGGNNVLFGRKKNGAAFPLEVGLSHGSAEGRTFAFATVIDISDRWTKDQELAIYRKSLEDMVRERTEDLDMALKTAEENSRFLGDILHSMSHEFRTPLNAILGFSELLLTMEQALRSEEGSETEPYLKLIHEAGSDLLALSTKATQMSVLSSGNVVASIDEVMLKPLIEQAIEKSDRYFTHYETTVKLEKGLASRLKADPVMLGRVLAIVLENASKYAGKAALVSVSSENIDGKVHIFIDDTGPGIPIDMRERAFKPFDLLDAGKGAISGMGLGLPLAKSYMKSMQGDLNIDDSPSGGTRIVLILPALD